MDHNYSSSRRRAILAALAAGVLSWLPLSVPVAASRTRPPVARPLPKGPTTVRLSARYGGHLGSKVNVPLSKLRARPSSHLAKLEFRAASQGANRIGTNMNAKNTSQPSNRRAARAEDAVYRINSYKRSQRQFSSLHSAQVDGSFRRVLRDNRARIDRHIASGSTDALKLVDRSRVPLGVVHSDRTGKTTPAYNVTWQLRTAGRRIFPHSAEAF